MQNINQAYTANHFRNQKSFSAQKKSAIILVGGGDGDPRKAYETLCGILRFINVKEIFPLVGSFKTNIVPAVKDEAAAKNIANLSTFLNIQTESLT